MMAEVNMSDAFLVSYHSIEKMLKNYHQKHFRHFIVICCFNSYLLYKQKNKTKNRLQIFKSGAPVQASTQFDVEVTQN
jgi:hypothetical protein